MPLRGMADQAHAARTAASEPHHVGACCGLVDKHQSGKLKHALRAHPTPTRASQLGALLIRRPEVFF